MYQFPAHGAPIHPLVLRDGPPIPSLGREFDGVPLGVLVEFHPIGPQALPHPIGVFRAHGDGHHPDVVEEGQFPSTAGAQLRGQEGMLEGCLGRLHGRLRLRVDRVYRRFVVVNAVSSGFRLRRGGLGAAAAVISMFALASSTSTSSAAQGGEERGQILLPRLSRRRRGVVPSLGRTARPGARRAPNLPGVRHHRFHIPEGPEARSSQVVQAPHAHAHIHAHIHAHAHGVVVVGLARRGADHAIQLLLPYRIVLEGGHPRGHVGQQRPIGRRPGSLAQFRLGLLPLGRRLVDSQFVEQIAAELSSPGGQLRATYRRSAPSTVGIISGTDERGLVELFESGTSRERDGAAGQWDAAPQVGRVLTRAEDGHLSLHGHGGAGQFGRRMRTARWGMGMGVLPLPLPLGVLNVGGNAVAAGADAAMAAAVAVS
mmetsp:Transcript_25156/g.73808  ORF Transcript_25156/g.73808 Transcript_25156/m.73808 type:complete len:428 (-) Transcript_25156:412-1695(-)